MVHNNLYYLYRYIRLDKNEVFYIGIGKKRTRWNNFRNYEAEYERAFTKKVNSMWAGIVAKSAIKVEILFETDSAEEIKDKEREFISLYGRRDLGMGTLANFTDGGDGLLEPSAKTRSKMSQAKVNGFCYSRGRFGPANHTSKKIYQYSLDGVFLKEWFGINEACRKLGIPNNQPISFASKSKSHRSYGYLWFDRFMGDSLPETMVPNNDGSFSFLKAVC